MVNKYYRLKNIFIAGFAGVCGFLYAVRFFNHKNTIKDILFEVIIYIFFPLYISVIIHELGHYINCKMLGMDVSLFSAASICIYKKNDKVKFKFEARGLFGAGRVIPKNYHINSQKELSKAILDLYNICLGGVVSSSIVFLIMIILFLFGNRTIIIYSFIFWNLNFLINSLTEHKGCLGDIYIYKNKGNLDGILLQSIFTNAMMFQGITNFLYEYIIKQIKSRIETNDIDSEILITINQVFIYNLDNKMNLQFNRYIADYFIYNNDRLLKQNVKQSLRTHIIIHNIIEYLTTYNNDKNTAEQLYNKLKKDFNAFNTMNHSWCKYYVTRTEKLLFNKDSRSNYTMSKYKSKADYMMGIGI